MLMPESLPLYLIAMSIIALCVVGHRMTMALWQIADEMCRAKDGR